MHSSSGGSGSGSGSGSSGGGCSGSSDSDSAGIFGGALANPVKESTKQCYQAYKQFCDKFPDYDVNVVLCAFSQKEMKEAQDVFKDFSI